MDLKEHMSYILLKSRETGISPEDLESVWKDCESSQKKDTPGIHYTDPIFTSKVMDRFDNKVNMVHVDKARRITMAREEFKRAGQSWVDALAQGNYVAAKEHFPNVVKSSFESLVDSRSKEFIAKFSEKLRKNSGA
jgi:hypothetical protein